MGWSGTKSFMWGDEPQDIVDNAISRYYGRVDCVDYFEYPDNVKKAAFDHLKGLKLLRPQVDRAFQREWGRGANDREFNNLLIVGLGMDGGRTVYWGRPKKSGKSKPKRKSHSSPSLRGLR